MDKAKALAWFEELETELRRLNETKVPEKTSEYRWVIGWHTDADAAMHACLPAMHPTLRRWVATKVTSEGYGWAKGFDEATALFETAHGLLRTGRLSSFVEAIRAETVGELLDQADVLAHGGYLSAAAITAGGALETTLRHLCDKAGITPAGDGSISKYEGAIAQARKAGNEVLSVQDGKLVVAWGGYRNDAAHDPLKFQNERNRGDVERMILGIRELLARVK